MTDSNKPLTGAAAKAHAEAQARKEAQAASPEKQATPRFTLTPDEVTTHVVVAKDGQSATVRLMAKPEAVRSLMDGYYGVGVWGCRHYTCGGTMYCGVGVRNLAGAETYRDAVAGPGTDMTDSQAVCDGSFVAACALWGIGRGIAGLPAAVCGSDRVKILPELGPDGRTVRRYVLDDCLRVEFIQYDDMGNVQAYQLRNREGAAIVWQRQK